MTGDSSPLSAHPSGEQPPVVEGEPPAFVDLDSFFGPVRVEWDREAAMTPLGQLPFFIDFLKASGLFDAFVADCPLRYVSPNAPGKRDVLGTTMLSMLAGHKRYAHIAALRCDGVLPELLGMKKVVSEDAVRRAFKAIDEEEGAVWLRGHLQHCVEPLLAEPWILDVDTTIKPLYGYQEGAALGYNPKKPGRPSHCYHTYSMALTRLVLDVDVSPGDEHTSKHSAPGLWALLDRLPRHHWPALLRGDCGFGNEGIMREAEARALPYLFKLRLTKNVVRMIEKLGARDWVYAGQGFQAKESAVRLMGWSRERRVIVLRRRLKDAVGLSYADEKGAPQLSFAEIGAKGELYEYSVLVTSLDEETQAFGQLYRDRGDGENIFDELKNHWGWGGFTTHDLARCRLAARLVALFYNWWNVFVRLAEPDWHREAMTSRPLFLTAIATRTRHARQTTIRVTSSHAEAKPAARALAAVAAFLRGLAETAEQLTRLQKWRAILSRAFQTFLKGRLLRAPPRLAAY
ncbi:MAG TPA: transposase [Methylocystis sp.]|nr:transposase [Methylocystis sp.]